MTPIFLRSRRPLALAIATKILLRSAAEKKIAVKSAARRETPKQKKSRFKTGFKIYSGAFIVKLSINFVV